MNTAIAISVQAIAYLGGVLLALRLRGDCGLPERILCMLVATVLAILTLRCLP